MKNRTFQVFPVDGAANDDAMQQSMVMPRRDDVDGKVWTNTWRGMRSCGSI